MTFHLISWIEKKIIYIIGIKWSIYIQQNWKVQLHETNFKNKIYFSLYANCSPITYQPNLSKFNLKNRSLKDTTKALLKGSKKRLETKGSVAL